MALRTKWDNPTKELKEHTWSSITEALQAGDPSLMKEVTKQWQQTDPSDWTEINLMKIISSLCDDNDD
eukprot:CAMPEP_0170959716 /NCGR_PEP_ID=MMETSP0735-20130129/36632_1 /TAXON_ID=186038 /ORGANISM="Fragilariopsis kerguelensis, Strain L26-C5" /LENGTH=67 /DNA_ID=CAMNT_0011374215 /DNA_START=137 /DNA_END=337 /DNA_ORIENTATION=+